MRMQKVYIRMSGRDGVFNKIRRRLGYRPHWAYVAGTAHGYGMGKTARAAQYNARKRRGY